MNNTFKKRIDELGRIVIPKQIRNSLKINNFEELELYVDKGSILIKKSIGIELFKDKIDRVLVFLSNYLDFKIIVTDKNNVISSNYEGVEYRNELLIEPSGYNFIETPILKGYLEKLPIIIDSNDIGSIYFISKSKFSDNRKCLKDIRNIIIDIIN